MKIWAKIIEHDDVQILFTRGYDSDVGQYFVRMVCPIGETGVSQAITLWRDTEFSVEDLNSFADRRLEDIEKLKEANDLT